MTRTFGLFYKYSFVGIIFGLLGALDVNAATAPILVDNKASAFGAALSEMSIDSGTGANDYRARQIQAQIDAYNNTSNTPKGSTNYSGANACDQGLRECMTQKCGAGFTKCASDNTVAWGAKIDACRAKTNCTGHEYALLAPEILADRDMNIRTEYYESVIACGDSYMSCIQGACGDGLSGCLAKKDEDRAIAACASIAKQCREQDSGLAARFMDVFGELRTLALSQVKKDEERLYELRDLMRASCRNFGAAFDERTLDCVYTVSFFTSDSANPMASKKLYAGDTFQCTPDWFGIDITTYRENALRETRAQTSASSAFMGAGLGTAAGLISSGAISRANDTRKAKNEAKDACKDAGKKWSGGKCVDKTQQDLEKEKQQAKKQQEKEQRKECNKISGKKWENGQCVDKGGNSTNENNTSKPQQTPTESNNNKAAQEKADAKADQYNGASSNTARESNSGDYHMDRHGSGTSEDDTNPYKQL